MNLSLYPVCIDVDFAFFVAGMAFLQVLEFYGSSFCVCIQVVGVSDRTN